MTKYGSTDEMQKLAWGGTKTSTPDVVTTIQNTVTSLINLVLNRSEDFATVPTYVSDVANLVGADILKQSRTREPLTTPQILDEIKVLMMSYIDQAPSSHGRWGNVRIV